MAMNWDKLLSPKRTRELEGGRESRKSEREQRLEVERDFDRTIFSTPVRRLHDKAQVFPLEPHDSVRTRLTHSLEVSCVARGIARQVSEWLAGNGAIKDHQPRQIEFVAATCAIIHDLGNPPFGHAGELAIADWFSKQLDANMEFFDELKESSLSLDQSQHAQDFLLFEGNAQTLRLVSRLQMLADFHGLNLTCATFSAACKYVAPSHEVENKESGPKERKKPGFFSSEQILVQAVRDETGTGESRNPITYLVEAADDLVYSVADLEDGVKKGVIGWKGIKKELAQWAEGDSLTLDCVNKAEEHVPERSTISCEADLDEARIQAFRVAAISRSVNAVVDAFKERYDEILEGSYHGTLVEDAKTAALTHACKKIGKRHVYCSNDTRRLEVMGRKVIHDLMDIFWVAASQYVCRDFGGFPRSIYQLMSPNYRRVFEEAMNGGMTNWMGSLPQDYHRMQLVTDYICGMTDSFACSLHKRLTNG